MLLWGRCRADAVFGVRTKRRRFNVCVRTQLTNLVPKGRLRMPQDASPGCTWTAREWRLATWAGCLEARIVHLRVRGTPGLHPGAFSAVPTGLVRLLNLSPGLPRISCTLLQMDLRMRLSLRKAA